MLDVSTAGRRGAGLLQATSLPFLVAIVEIGLDLGEITPETGATLISTGPLPVIVFPIVALGLLKDGPEGAGGESRRRRSG